MSDKLSQRLNGLAYHRPSQETQANMAELRTLAMDFMMCLNGRIDECREKSLAVTAFEEAMMWAMKALALTDPNGTIASP